MTSGGFLPIPDPAHIRVDVYRGGGTAVRVTWTGPGPGHTVVVDADGIGTICARERAVGALAARLAADGRHITPPPPPVNASPDAPPPHPECGHQVGHDDHAEVECCICCMNPCGAVTIAAMVEHRAYEYAMDAWIEAHPSTGEAPF